MPEGSLPPALPIVIGRRADCLSGIVKREGRTRTALKARVCLFLSESSF